jgi:hypothetical protein
MHAQSNSGSDYIFLAALFVAGNQAGYQHDEKNKQQGRE